jgi:adenylate cyclase
MISVKHHFFATRQSLQIVISPFGAKTFLCATDLDGRIEQHHGRFVNSAGDSVLAEFTSVVEAVNCAVEIQNDLKAQNASLPPERRMEFRIGINSGDVMVEGEQIYGDGVNVAARLESLTEPGALL